MADLPVVVLGEIFDFLSIPERLRVRTTCKKWKFVIETFNSPQSLCLYSTGYPSRQRWCFSNQKVTEDEMLYLKRDYGAGHRFDPRVEFLRNLQKIYLYYIGERVGCFLQELNHLTRLKVLMIEEVKGEIKITNQPITLSLPCLEKLSLKCSKCDLELETPKLNSFVVWAIFNQDNLLVKFCFPLKVKHLECFNFTSNLSQLKNLETLVCQEITFDFRLADFESLTRLEIWPSERQLETVRRTQKERNRLNRSGLELIVSGFKEELIGCDINKCNNSLHLNESYLEQIERNRTKFVGSAPWKASLEIGALVQFADRIPNELFERFLNIRCIRILLVSPLEELGIYQSRLIEIIKRLNPEIIRTRMNLTNEFYDQLSRIESIKKLIITIRGNNYGCLLNLKNLNFISIASETIPVDFICKMVEQLRFLSFFEFSTSTHFEFEIRTWFSKGSETAFPFSLRYNNQG